MPLPKPKKNEEKDAFIDRCMGDDVMVEEYPDESQRRAVCETQWDESKEQDKTKNETFDCECIECGYQTTSEEHCKDLTCPECGGTMRRKERPGPGEDTVDNKKTETVGLKVTKNAKEKSADIWVYGDIGEGWFGGFSAKQFADEVKKLGKVDIINVYINSPGGDVFDGVAIYNILLRNRAKVIIEIDALAASIASIITMAGDEIRMAENALMMIHNPWGMVIGDVSDFQKAIDDLNKIKDSSILPPYQKQTGMEEKDLSKLMDDETWMNATEAKEYGFIDEIVDGKQIAAHIDREKYKNVFRKIPEKIEVAEKPEESIADSDSTGKEKPAETKSKAKKQKKKNISYWEQRIKERSIK